MKNKGFFYELLSILLCIWQLPQFILSLFFFLFLGKTTKVADRHHNICFIGEKMSGGISLGTYSFVSKKLGKNELAVSHELDGHTVQSKILGPLYLPIVGLPSILFATYKKNETCYYSFWTEKWANDCAGLTVDENCRLIRK